MVARYFREYVFQLVVGLTVTATVAILALINKYWTWPNAIVGSALLMCAVLYLMEKLGIGPSLKSRIRDWLDNSAFAIQTIQDKNECHFVMTDNIGIKTDIIQVKVGGPVALATAGHKATAQQLATFNAMSEERRQHFWKMVRLELLRYGVSFSDLKLDAEGVTFSDTLAIGPSLNEADFLRKMLTVRTVARLYWELLRELDDPKGASVSVSATRPSL